jgi:Tfp pilus assembly protein PilX
MKTDRRIHEETGSALVAGLIILFIILGFGIAALATSDTQSHQTGHEASGEAAYNLAEGALDSEANLLQQAWPSAATTTCNQSSAASTYCPGTAFTNSFSTTYAGHWFTGATWSVQLVDDNGSESSNYYIDSVRSTASSYDQNADDKIWIRAQANIGGQQRVVVAEMIRTKQVISLPKNVITAGGTYTSNDGNKVIINANDNAYGGTGAGPLNIRCTVPGGGPTYGNTCAGWDPGKGQLSPSGDYSGSYSDPNGGGSPVSSTILNQLKYTAQSAGTYYNGVCPSSLSGIVYVDNPPGGNCTYTQGQFNGPYTTTGCPATSPTPCPATTAKPGAVIFGSGTLEINGPVDYYGIIFMVNPTSPAMVNGFCTSFDGPVFWVHGGANIFGGIFVNGCGTVNAGDSAANVDYDSAAFAGFSAYPIPELAKNTFRIISNN